MKTIIIPILALFVFAGCNSEKQQSTDKATDHHGHDHGTHGGDPRVAEVMAIHDSIMPSVGKIMDLKQKLTADLKTTDSLLALQPAGDLKKRKEEAFALHIQLDKADQGMMNWMHQYKADTLTKMNEQAATAYIADQKTKIEAVRDHMVRSIKDAQAFTEKR
jgi:hypothetical protein